MNYLQCAAFQFPVIVFEGRRYPPVSRKGAGKVARAPSAILGLVAKERVTGGGRAQPGQPGAQ
eukprot:3414858-Lingulodinium_polyedra.AAC.1